MWMRWPGDAGGGEQYFGAGVDEAGRLEQLSRHQVAFGLSQRLMNFPAMEFWARSRWGGIGTHGARCQTSDSSVSASDSTVTLLCSLGCLQ